MTILSKAALGAATLLLLLLLAAPDAGIAAGFLLDPVVTHTNGMRLASSTSTRSHNVYWQCDDGHVGYCDGVMHTHCRDELRKLGTRCHGRFVPPYTPMGPTSPRASHSIDGLEPASGESLGLLANEAPRLPAAPAAAGGAAASAGAPSLLPSAPPAGGAWLDAIQTIGKKMMTTPAGS